jgi:hypothetical protein
MRDQRRAALTGDIHGWASRYGSMASVPSSGPHLWSGQYITLLGSRLDGGADIEHSDYVDDLQ